jgi:hypothetical protein
MTYGTQAAGGRMFTPVGMAALNAQQRKANKALESKLIDAIVEDPEVQHPTNISVFAREESGDRHVHIIGKLVDEKEKERVEEIVANNTPNDTVIVNEVVLD